MNIDDLKKVDNIYHKNVVAVWNILKDIPAKYRKLFVKNMKGIRIESVSLDKIKDVTNDGYANGVYLIEENKVYLSNVDISDTEINHELFHVASSCDNRCGVIGSLVRGNKSKVVGNNLTEGVTDFFAFLSTKDLNYDYSFYQIDLFVVEMLYKIYGMKIFYPYFEANAVSFYRQFGDLWVDVVKLDMLLERINKNVEKKNLFDQYIGLRELDKEALIKNGLYLNGLKYDCYHIAALDKWLKIHEDTFDLLEENMEALDIDIENEDNGNLYDYWHKEYKKNQKDSFESILKILIKIGKKNHFSNSDIKDMVIESLSNKSNGIDMIEYKNKKLIRK